MNVDSVMSGMNDFNKQCLSNFNRTIDIEYKKMCDIMHENVENSIMTMIGKDLYDYSDINVFAKR